MGCDIHGWVEVRVGDKYIAVAELKDRNRNYRRFAKLAGVRNYNSDECKTPLGVPDDVSETTKYYIDKWGEDGHSHSYMSVREAMDIFNSTADEESQWPEYTFFDLEPEDIDNHRVVFWFDN